MYERLEQFLSSRQVRYETVTHEAAVTAQEQAAVMHTAGDRVAKVLIVKERDGFVMAILPASTELDLDRLKGLIGHGDIRLATVEECRSAAADCAPGAIPPFGGLYGLRSFVDRGLLAVPEVTMPAGDAAGAIRMGSAEFRRIVDAVAGDFAIPASVIAAGGIARPRRSRGRTAEAPARGRRQHTAATQSFYRTVRDITGDQSGEAAERATAEVFHALRDRLIPEEADQVAAQLPAELKTVWAEGDRAERRPVKMDQAEFCARVKQAAGLASERQARWTTLAVFAALKAQISRGEATDVLAQLPEDLKELWVEAQPGMTRTSA